MKSTFFEIFFRNMALVGAVLLLYSETMQEARTIFAGVPSMGEDSKPKVSKRRRHSITRIENNSKE